MSEPVLEDIWQDCNKMKRAIDDIIAMRCLEDVEAENLKD